MSYLDNHPAGHSDQNRRGKTLEFLTGFAGWFALFSTAWFLAPVFAPAEVATSPMCLYSPMGIDMLAAVLLIATKRRWALAGFVAAFIVNGIGILLAALVGSIPLDFTVPALVLHIPFYIPLIGLSL